MDCRCRELSELHSVNSSYGLSLCISSFPYPHPCHPPPELIHPNVFGICSKICMCHCKICSVILWVCFIFTYILVCSKPPIPNFPPPHRGVGSTLLLEVHPGPWFLTDAEFSVVCFYHLLRIHSLSGGPLAPKDATSSPLRTGCIG